MKRKYLLLETLESRILWDAVPSATIDIPAEKFINEQVNFSVNFDNTSPTETGYGPYVDIHMPEGFDFGSATYLGTPINTVNVGKFPTSGDLTHPFTKQTITGTPGDTLYVLELPFGSFTPSQPVAPITITAIPNSNSGAQIGIALPVKVQGGFRYGKDPLDNPSSDPPILGTKLTGTLTPTLMTLTKTSSAPEGEIATGPNFPVTYTLTLDVATGKTITGVLLQDLLPKNLEYLPGSVTVPSGWTILDVPLTPGPQNPPGNDFRLQLASITGVSGPDAVITYQAFVPEKDANSAYTISPVTGDDTSSINNANVSATFNASTVSASSSYTLQDKSIAIQKSVRIVKDTNAPGATPGDTLEYTLNFQVSDYFRFDQAIVFDTFSDGQIFDTSFNPTLYFREEGSIVANNTNFQAVNFDVVRYGAAGQDGRTEVTFRVSNELVSAGSDAFLTGDLFGGSVSWPWCHSS